MASFKQFEAGCKLKLQQNQKQKECKSSSKIQSQLLKNGNVDQQKQTFLQESVTRDQKQNQIKKQAENESRSEILSQESTENNIENYHSENSEGNKLTYGHLEQFRKVYSLVGSNWTRILQILNEEHEIFLGSSVDELKNLFFNSMRKVAKLFENQNWNTRRRVVKNAKSYLLSMLEIVNQADRVMLENGLKPNPQSLMQKFKSHILTLCFDKEDFSQEVVSELLQVTRYLGKKMKCFGIFKVKNKKNWKLTKQSFSKMMQFDRITLNDLQSHIDSFETDSLIAHDEQLNHSWMKRSFSNVQIQLKLIEQEKDKFEESDSLNLMYDEKKPFIFL